MNGAVESTKGAVIDSVDSVRAPEALPKREQAQLAKRQRAEVVDARKRAKTEAREEERRQKEGERRQKKRAREEEERQKKEAKEEERRQKKRAREEEERQKKEAKEEEQKRKEQERSAKKRDKTPIDARRPYNLVYQWEPMAPAFVESDAESVLHAAWTWSQRAALLGDLPLVPAVAHPELLGPSLEQLREGVLARARAMTPFPHALAPSERAVASHRQDDFPADPPRPIVGATKNELDRITRDHLDDAHAGYVMRMPTQSACDHCMPPQRRQLAHAEAAAATRAAADAMRLARARARARPEDEEAARWALNIERRHARYEDDAQKLQGLCNLPQIDHDVSSRVCDVDKGDAQLSHWHVGLLGGLGNVHRFLGYGHETSAHQPADFDVAKPCGYVSVSEGAAVVETMLHTLGDRLRASTRTDNASREWWSELSSAPPRVGTPRNARSGFGRAYLGFAERHRFDIREYLPGEHELQLLPAKRAPSSTAAAPMPLPAPRALPPEVAARRQLLALLGSPVMEYVAATALAPPASASPTAPLSVAAKRDAALVGILSALGGARARAHVQRLSECWNLDKNGTYRCAKAQVNGLEFYVLDRHHHHHHDAANAANAANADAKKQRKRAPMVRSVLRALAGVDERTRVDHIYSRDPNGPMPYAPEGCTSHLVPVFVQVAVDLFRGVAADAVGGGTVVDDRALATLLWQRAKTRLGHQAVGQAWTPPSVSRVWRETEAQLTEVLGASASSTPTPPETLDKIRTALERLDEVHERLARSTRCADDLVNLFDTNVSSHRVASDLEHGLFGLHVDVGVKHAALQHMCDARCHLSRPLGPAKDPTRDVGCSDRALALSIEDAAKSHNQHLSEEADRRIPGVSGMPTQAQPIRNDGAAIRDRVQACERLVWCLSPEMRAQMAATVAMHSDQAPPGGLLY